MNSQEISNWMDLHPWGIIILIGLQILFFTLLFWFLKVSLTWLCNCLLPKLGDLICHGLKWAGTLLKREWRQEWRHKHEILLSPEENKKRFKSPGKRKEAPIHGWN